MWALAHKPNISTLHLFPATNNFKIRIQNTEKHRDQSSMASKSDMKGFYKQQKKGGISKTKPKSKSASSSSSTPKQSAISGADKSPAIDLQDQYGENENVLSQFDMNMAYGPCLGMTRLERWERAKALGLNPPNDLLCLLGGKNVRQECLWDCRV